MQILISGAGAVSSAGLGADSLLEGCGGKPSSLVAIPQKQPPFNSPCQVFSADDFDPVAVLGKKGLQFLTRSTQLLMAAAVQAIRQAAFDLDREQDNLGLVVGTNLAQLATIAGYDWTVVSEGPSCASAIDAPNTLANAPASQLAIRFGAKSVNTTISTGRCASLDAIGYGAHFLEQMRSGAILAGGTEEVNPYVLWQLETGGIGTGTVIPGEAAAVVLLQGQPNHANHAPGLAQVRAWTNTLAPHYPPERLVHEVCMEVLELAGLKPEHIRLVGIDIADESDLPLAEGVCRTLRVLNGNSRPVPAFSLRGRIGQTLGAAGALYAVAVVNAFSCKRVPVSGPLTIRRWPGELAFDPAPQEFDLGEALIVSWDPNGFASALVLAPN